MPASTSTTSPNPSAHWTKPCPKCGAKEWQRKPRRLYHRLFALYPYVCGQCVQRKLRFRIKAWGVVRLMLVVGIAAIASWLLLGRPRLFRRRSEESAQGGAEGLARARATAGGLTSFEQMMIKKPRQTMDNAAILKLWKASVGTDVILQLIRTSNPDYDLTAASIIELKQAGVDQSIVLAMIDASYQTR